jgi:hypothetical protein
MSNKLDGTGRDYDLASIVDDDSSGVRENPWLSWLRTATARLDGAPGGRLDGRWALAGAEVLGRFEGLSHEDRIAAFDAAIVRLSCLPAPTERTEARFAHAVLCEAILVEKRRWMEQLGAPPAEVARQLDLARQRAAALAGREKSVFVAVCALDDTASGDEIGKVVLRAAVAYQVRWNTAHQNVSRAWRKICEGSPLGAWCKDWRAGHRFVCGLPSFELWEAARAYMDACSGKGDHGGAAFEAWVRAHEAHNAWFSEWKKQSSRAARRWRDFAGGLDASGIRPGAVHAVLVQECSALGIDRCVVPARLRQQSWSELLEATHRPSPAARGAWLSFLREHGFGADVEAAFRALERDASLADVACVELEHAYARLLAAAESAGGASRSAREVFCARVEGGGPRDDRRADQRAAVLPFAR